MDNDEDFEKLIDEIIEEIED